MGYHTDAEYERLFDAYMLVEHKFMEAKAIILATYYAPEEGTSIPVFRVPTKDLDAKINRFLEEHMAERYIPKEKRK